jgi:Ca2+-binding EF-hand superfamily protein
MAANTSASRQRETAKIQAAVQKERNQIIKRCNKYFDDYSDDGEFIDEEKVPGYLADVLGVSANKLDQDGIRLVVATAKKESEGGDKVTKDALIKGVQKFSEYIRRKKEIDAIFDQFDKNRDGEMSRKELKKFLIEHEKAQTRAVRGIVVHLMVHDEDIDFILAESDIDGDGKIDRVEVLTAIATWEQIANLELKKREESSCCVIL